MIRGNLRGLWATMLRRCNDPHRTRYGARGITVCARWRESFDNFADDVGFREEDGLSLDRVNNDAGYWCGRAECVECGPASRPCNVRWARATTQGRNKSNNRMVTAHGETLCLSAWAERTGVEAATIKARLDRGWPAERAVSAASTPKLPLDLAGRRFGRLVALSPARRNGVTAWLCRCDCGNEKVIQTTGLRSGQSTSCGCKVREAMAESIKARQHDLAGQRFGRWSVVALAMGKGARAARRWFCRCDCGAEKTVLERSLLCGESTSCGCYAREVWGVGARKHGLYGSPGYQAWRSMRQRCENPKCQGFAHYGARGIKVCNRWRESFAAFIEDMGPKPSPAHSIDRIDPNGDYEPSNCRWATQVEQARNRRNNRMVTAHGQTKCVTEWAEAAGLKPSLIIGRLDRGWPPDRAVSEPVGLARTAPALLTLRASA